MIKRRIDDLGRISIPSDLRKQIGLGNGIEAEIKLDDNKIILTNPENMKSKEEIKRKITNLTAEHPFGENMLVDGFIEALKWVLNEED